MSRRCCSAWPHEVPDGGADDGSQFAGPGGHGALLLLDRLEPLQYLPADREPIGDLARR
jgi:hypothetical protein